MYACSRTSVCPVSQSGEERQICGFAIFWLYSILVRVFLWVASADIACLSVDDANGAL